MSDYRHALAPAEIDEGITACWENAERLRNAALLHLEHGDYGLAEFLASVRIEELGKIILLAQAKRGPLPGGSWKAFWGKFHSHSSKWLAFSLKYKNRIHGMTENAREALLWNGIRDVANLKNLGLYVGHGQMNWQRKKVGWIVPSQVPLKENALHSLGMGDQGQDIALAEAIVVGVKLMPN